MPEDPDSPIIWVDAATLEAGTLPRNGHNVTIPPDVQALALEAIRQAARLETTTAVTAR